MADDGWQVPLRQRRQPLTTELSSKITYAEVSHGLEIVQRIDIEKKHVAVTSLFTLIFSLPTLPTLVPFSLNHDVERV